MEGMICCCRSGRYTKPDRRQAGVGNIPSRGGVQFLVNEMQRGATRGVARRIVKFYHDLFINRLYCMYILFIYRV